MKLNRTTLFIAITLIVTMGLYYFLDLGNYLSLDYLKSRQHLFQRYSSDQPVLAIGCYFLTVFLLSALSLPGVSVIIMFAGSAFFNFWTTLVVASFADTLGSTAAFLMSRHLFTRSIETKYPDQLRIINRGIETDGGFYLFSLRLMFFFPCFMINLLMGLTALRTLTFYWVTQLGKLPYKIIFAYTGMELGQMNAAVDLLSPKLVISFTLIGLFPLLSKKSVQWFRKRKTKRSNCCQSDNEKQFWV
jgi:uncharacterized membrane protein YdjX (TVP38/TMEM64 family)